jgi:transcription initiation factor TFIIIB Brf1 subunit/transcription initiation factor TFIIB
MINPEKSSEKPINKYTLSSESQSNEDDYENYFEDRQQVFDGTQEQACEFTNHHVIRRTKEKSIKNDLKKAGFPHEIIIKADEVFIQMDCGLKRGSKTKGQLLYFCVQSAYNLLNIPEDPCKIASMCGISNSEISKANSMCSPSKTKFKAPLKNWTPQDYLATYFQKLLELEIINFKDDALIDIENICNEVMSKCDELKDEKPQTVAAATIVFYLELHNCAINKSRYNEIFSKSEVTICKLKKKIKEVYNSL